MRTTFWWHHERTRGFTPAFLLAFACAIACQFLSVRSAEAQNASIGLYTDPSGSTCSFSGNSGGVFSAYVVYRPDANGVNAVQFAAPVPSCLGAVYLSETLPPGMVSIGNSQAGISIALGGCYGQPVSVLKIDYFRSGSTDPCCAYSLVPDPSSGSSFASNCAYEDNPTTVVTSHFNADASCACVGNSAPSEPSLIAPYDGEVGVFTTRTLNWLGWDYDNNVAGYDVYLGTTPSPPLAVAGLTEGSYAPTLEGLTQYYWRVVVRDAFGLEATGPVWTFTTRLPNTPPVAPSSPNPANTQESVALNTNLTWVSGDIDGDPVSYDVYFGTSSPPPLVAADIAPMFYTPALAPVTTYYWRIVARAAGAETSGPTWTFTTRPLNLPPFEPQLVSPPSPSTNRLLNTVLDWNGSDPDLNVLEYDVYFGTASTPPLVASDITPSSYAPAGLAFSTEYFWRIVARDTHGAETSGSTWRFTTRPANFPPNLPSNPSPANSAMSPAANTTLGWQCSDADGHSITYDVYLGTTLPPPLVATDRTSAVYAPGPLQEWTVYRWQIVARDQLGAVTTGPVWTFTANGNVAPNLPSSPSPANGSNGRSIHSTLSWNCSDVDGDAITYDIYFGTILQPPLIATNVVAPSYAPGTLPFATTHYWRILARDSHGNEASGPTWSFTTKSNSPPVAASNPSPGNNVTAPVAPVLTWTSSDVDLQPLTFNLYLGPTTSPPLVAAGLTSASFATDLIVASGQYFWRVDASDGLATTPGPLWTFRLALPGDVDLDGVVDAADAACALQIYLRQASCGGVASVLMADADCSGSVTPSDARCIHQYAASGACEFCGNSVVTPPASHANVPLVTVGAISLNGDTLSIQLAVSGIASLGAFGFDVEMGSMRLRPALRHGLTSAFTAVEVFSPAIGEARVGAYSLISVAVGAATEFIDMRFDITRGIADQVVISGFVDDLAGAATLEIPLGTTVDVRPILPGLVLHQNHPNPFNPQTTISYELPATTPRARVRLWILDISGRVVRSLVDEDQDAGPHEVRWEGRDDNGAGVSSGVYFYVLDVAGERRTRKLVLLK